jgi:hypothetical protein
MSNTNSLGSDYYRALLETESNAGSVSNNEQSTGDHTDFFTDLMQEINEEPLGGAGGPNSMVFKYEKHAKEYNDVDPNLAQRIRNHGKDKVRNSFPDYETQNAGSRKKRTNRRSTRKARKERKRYQTRKSRYLL